ncbi:MAG: hypothetical protein WBA89_27085 [Microcoleus sp.]|uniref:hypothetical protein n=1 Tax=Microcoleus sp. TaxID=44472 RepID=UPI003C768929
MADIRQIISQLAAGEGQLLDTQFLAPCVRGERVRTRIGGMTYLFQPQPQNFEGWAIFEPVNENAAAVIEQPILPQVAEYLQLLMPIRLHLACVLQGQTWLAYPVNESDAKQRTGAAKPVPVHADRLLANSALAIDTFDNSVGRQAVKDYCTTVSIPCLHVGLSADYSEIMWNQHYRVPSAANDRVCDYPLARNLVMLTVAVACKVIVTFAATR